MGLQECDIMNHLYVILYHYVREDLIKNEKK